MSPYDAWALRSPPETDLIGIHDGEACNRYPEPDEDQPRGYKPKPCQGTMVEDGFSSEILCCDTCGDMT